MNEFMHEWRRWSPLASLSSSRLVAFLGILSAAGLGLLVWTVRPAETERQAAAAVAPGPSALVPLPEILAHPDIIPTHHHPLLGQPAPEFELADAQGKVWTLEKLRAGRPTVLIFYYGYHCISCVRGLVDVNRELTLFREAGGQVVAISADPPELTRRRFEENGPFAFPILSDPGNKVAQSYRLVKGLPGGDMNGNFRHGTFVIDPAGLVHWVNVGDAPFRRNRALLCQLAMMKSRLPLAQSGKALEFAGGNPR